MGIPSALEWRGKHPLEKAALENTLWKRQLRAGEASGHSRSVSGIRECRKEKAGNPWKFLPRSSFSLWNGLRGLPAEFPAGFGMELPRKDEGIPSFPAPDPSGIIPTFPTQLLLDQPHAELAGIFFFPRKFQGFFPSFCAFSSSGRIRSLPKTRDAPKFFGIRDQQPGISTAAHPRSGENTPGSRNIVGNSWKIPFPCGSHGASQGRSGDFLSASPPGI